MVKYIVLMTHHERVISKVDFLGKVYRRNTSDTSRNIKTLKLWSKRLCTFAKYTKMLYKWFTFLKCLMENPNRYGVVPTTFTTSLLVFYAVGSTLLTGKRELILNFMIPYVNAEERNGFLIVSLYHLSGLILATFGTCGADFMLVVLVFHLWPLGDIFENMCSELNDGLLTVSNRRTPELRRFYINIFKMHKEICIFLEDISYVYYYMVFVEIYTCAMSMCSLLYCIFKVSLHNSSLVIIVFKFEF